MGPPPRVAICRAIARLVTTVLSPFESLFSFDRDPATRSLQPNALLTLSSIRDVRRPETSRIAESVGTNAIALWLVGVRVLVDRSVEPMHLLVGASAVDTLVLGPDGDLVRSGRWGPGGPSLGLLFDRSG